MTTNRELLLLQSEADPQARLEKMREAGADAAVVVLGGRRVLKEGRILESGMMDVRIAMEGVNCFCAIVELMTDSSAADVSLRTASTASTEGRRRATAGAPASPTGVFCFKRNVCEPETEVERR